MSGFTPGPWRVGKCKSVVACDAIIEGAIATGHNARDEKEWDYYGGNLIAESIFRIEDACLISAAPDMYAALKKIAESWADGFSTVARAEIEAALAKAEGFDHGR